MGYDFVGVDDPFYLSNNDAVLPGLTAEGVKEAFRSDLSVYPTPLTFISYMIDIELFGKEPAAFHRTNVIIFALSTGLFCWCLFALSGASGPSLLASALFAAHPLRVESVAWVSERKDLLAGFFFLLALLAWRRYLEKRRPVHYMAALLAMAMSLSSKPAAVTLPALLILLDWWPFGRLSELPAKGGRVVYSHLILEKIPFLFLAVCSAIVSSSRMAAYADPLGLAQRFDAASWSFFHYLGKTVWPTDLAFRSSYSFSPKLGVATAGSLTAILGITVGAYLLRHRAPALSVGWFWFALAVIPASGLQQTGVALYADRFTYFPHFGLAAALAGIIGNASRLCGTRRHALAAVGVLLVAILVLLTQRQLPHWRDGVTLMEHSRAVAPEDPLVAMFLGAAYGAQGRYTDAVKSYLEGLATVDTFLASHIDVAHYAERLKMHELAESHYRRALEIQPNDPKVAVALGLLLAKQGRIPEAYGFFHAVVGLTPDSSDAHFNLARAAEILGRPAEAVEHYYRAAQLDPNDAQARLHLATTMVAAGRTADAVSLFREVLRIDPGSIDATRGLEELGEPIPRQH